MPGIPIIGLPAKIKIFDDCKIKLIKIWLLIIKNMTYETFRDPKGNKMPTCHDGVWSSHNQPGYTHSFKINITDRYIRHSQNHRNKNVAELNTLVIRFSTERQIYNLFKFII